MTSVNKWILYCWTQGFMGCFRFCRKRRRLAVRWWEDTLRQLDHIRQGNVQALQQLPVFAQQPSLLAGNLHDICVSLHDICVNLHDICSSLHFFVRLFFGLSGLFRDLVRSSTRYLRKDSVHHDDLVRGKDSLHFIMTQNKFWSKIIEIGILLFLEHLNRILKSSMSS